MRTILLMLLLLPALLLRLALAAPVQTVTITASLDKPVYHIGQPIVLELDLHNSGMNQALLYGGAFERAAFHITITNVAGKPVPRSALGNQVLTPPLVAHANPERVLKPGGTRRLRYDLAELFALSTAGTYFLSVSRILYADSRRQVYIAPAGPLKIRIVKATQNSPATPFVHDPQADDNTP